MTYVLLQAPNDGYYWIVPAGTKKHFELEDSNYSELASGTWDEVLELKQNLEWQEETIILKGNDGYTITTEDGLHHLIRLNPNFLNENKFI